MNVSDKYQEIGILLAEDGFISILKQVTVTIVSSVKRHGIAREEPSHDRRYGCVAGAEEEAGMVGDQSPGIAACGGLL